jgi:hypothetical protein
MKCEYCGTADGKGKICDKCGAVLSEPKQENLQTGPFFYNGYVCFSLLDYMSDTVEVQFWLGRELIQRIAVSRELMRLHVPDGGDSMSFFWDLFLIAEGEKEVLEWVEKNKKYPASFKISRSENIEVERWRSMSMRDIAQEATR